MVGKEKCAVCGKKCSFVPICSDCKDDFFSVQKIGQGFCARCGKKLISEKDKCVECRNEGILKNLDRVFPLFSYRLWNTNLLCRWKLKGERNLSFFFAELVKDRILDMFEKFGEFSIVPVPPRPGKIKREGWDQIEELSVILERLYGFKIFRILGRESLEQQKTLDREKRLLTIGSAYFVKDKKSPLPEKVCIIDDVMTTGATLEGIATVLKKNGVKEVFAVTLFTVDT